MDNDISKMLQLLIDNTGDDFFEFIRKNLNLLKSFSFTLGNELYKIPVINSDYKDYYSFLDTIEIVKEFLESINPSYKEKFEEMVNNGVIRIREENEEEGNYLDWLIDEEGNTKLDIKIQMDNTLEDSFALTHEFFHTTNIEYENGLNRYLLSEAISYTYELLLYDFLKNKNVSRLDNVLTIINNVNHKIERCDYLSKELEVLEKAINSFDKLNEYDISDEEESDEDYFNDVDELEKNIIDDIKYVVAGLISILLFYNYKIGNISLENIDSLNKGIINGDNLESLRHVFLNIPNLDDIKLSCDFLNNDLFDYYRNGKNKKY